MDNWRLKELLALYQENDSDDFVTYAIAQEYLKTKDYLLSEKFFLMLKQKNPDYIGLYYHLASLYEELDRKDEALSVYNEGILRAKKIGDLHTLSELKNAKVNFEMGL